MDKLQFQLGQLAYTLINFDLKDQVKCLTSFWTKELNAYIEKKEVSNTEVQRLNENEVQGLQEIAKSIVEQFAADPRDKDKSLIGIPLQCRILAECFLQKVQNALEYTRKNNSKTLPQKFASDNVNKKFDLVTLYQMGSN